MTRPKNLPVALQSWALTNYSAGPSWGGTPQRAAPGAAFFTPGITLPAENVNYLYGNAFDGAQGAINAVGQLSALNWGPSIAMGATGITLAFSDAEQAWYSFAVSATTVKRSPDFNQTWATSGALAVANGASSCCDAAFDASGNACLVTLSGTNVQQGPLVSYGTAITWVNQAAALGASGGAAGIVFEPVSGLFCVVGVVSSSVAWMYTSSNRTAWTARTVPGTWTSAGNIAAAIGSSGPNGILVATFTNTVTTQFRTMRSADGGITWTNDQAIVQNAGITLVAGTPTTRPVWSATDGLWYVAVSQGSTRKTQVFSSPDGITWTSAATLLTNDCRFVSLQCLGSLLVAINDDGRIFCSVNQGANWLRCGATLNPGSPSAAMAMNNMIRAGGNGILLISAATAAVATASQRFGLPVTAA